MAEDTGSAQGWRRKRMSECCGFSWLGRVYVSLYVPTLTAVFDSSSEDRLGARPSDGGAAAILCLDDVTLKRLELRGDLILPIEGLWDGDGRAAGEPGWDMVSMAAAFNQSGPRREGWFASFQKTVRDGWRISYMAIMCRCGSCVSTRGSRRASISCDSSDRDGRVDRVYVRVPVCFVSWVFLLWCSQTEKGV